MKPERKKNRLESYDYSSNGDYFITVCVSDFEELLSNVSPDGELTLTHIGSVVENTIKEIESHYDGVFLRNCVIMPNHVHLLLSLRADLDERYKLPNISSVVGSFKSNVSKRINMKIWQKSFYDHVILYDEEYDNIYDYIDANPLVWNRDKLNRRIFRDLK